MATTIWMWDGTDATQDFSFWPLQTIGGAATSDATVSFTGRSAKIACSSLTTFRHAALLADAGRRLSFRFRFDTVPTTNATILQVTTSAAAVILSLDVTSAGKLLVVPTGTSVGNGTGNTVLNVNTWYRITFSYTITSSTVYSVNVYLNGHLEINLTGTGTLTNTTSDRLLISNATQFGAGAFVWFDDMFLDNGTDLGDPGNIIVTNKRPNANGASNGFTTQIGSGGSGYGTGHSPQVNEQPLSTTNGWSIASASALTEEYTIEGASVGDIDITNPRYSLVDYMGWIHAKTATAGTRNIVLNGSATNITTTTSFANYFKVAGSTTYPSTNTAIGMDNNSVNNLTSLAECGILLAVRLPRRRMSTV